YAASGGSGGSNFERVMNFQATRSRQVHAVFAVNFGGSFTRVIATQFANPSVSDLLFDNGAEADVLAVNAYAGHSYFEDGAPSNPSLSGMFAAINNDIDEFPSLMSTHRQYGLPLVAYEG